MKYKALIFDLDGTAIEKQIKALPSETVIGAVKKAKKKVIVSVATGRPFNRCKNIIQKLGVTDLCIVSGGTEIIDPVSEKVVWTKIIPKTDLRCILDVCAPYPYEILFSKEIKGFPAKDKKIISDENVVFIMNVDPENTSKIVAEINKNQNLIAHETSAWKEGKLDIHVTHKLASKKNALVEWLKILNLKTSDVIAVGDQNNDIPLFEIAGYNIAVNNASEKLKSMANYIAPSVTNDGLAHVINKFILKI